MKLSELSYREYIALEVFPTIIARTHVDELAARRAFSAADAFLREVGKENDKVASAERRAEKVEAQVSLLLNMNEDGNFASRVALLEIWEFIGVDNQTAAMEALRARWADRT